MKALRAGDTGAQVRELQRRLRSAGFGPRVVDGDFGPATLAALRAFQGARALKADGVAGPVTWAALAGVGGADRDESTKSTRAAVERMFPAAARAGIARHLPAVLEALAAEGLSDTPMTLMALATIRAETESFRPISEHQSKYNTTPGGHPFDRYDNRADLGNRGAPDGERFRGRGFVQLTGRDNYTRYSRALFGDDRLVENPKLANHPDVAARLLARFLKDKERRIRAALAAGDLAAARRLVNGGTHGLARFMETYRTGEQAFGALGESALTGGPGPMPPARPSSSCG